MTELDPATTTPEWDFVCGWYRPHEVEQAIQESGGRGYGAWDKIPTDVFSREFAEWLTHQYRLAMNKGIQIGKSRDRHSAARVAELESENAELKRELSLANSRFDMAAGIAMDALKEGNAP